MRDYNYMDNGQKHPGGRPLKFPSAEILQNKIDEYFCETPEREWTVTGLALALDTYRDVLLDYCRGQYDSTDPQFSCSVKKAYAKVHNAYEKDLRDKGRSGDIFALKNFGWRDIQQVELSGEIKIMDKIKVDNKDLNLEI